MLWYVIERPFKLWLYFQESDGDEEGEGEEEIDDEVEEEGENESKTAAGADDVATKLDSFPTVAREPERQLSKKELKKKELADLEAVLAELGLDKKEEKEENGEYFLHDLNRLTFWSQSVASHTSRWMLILAYHILHVQMNLYR